MENVFAVFPSINFVDLGLYQFGREQCTPAYSFGPATRNHFLFYYILQGRGVLRWQDSRRRSHETYLKAGQGFLICPGQITTYTADEKLPWEYCWLEFDGLRAKELLTVSGLSIDQPVYQAVHKNFEIKMRDEMLYIVDNRMEAPYHLVGHLFLFIDALARSLTTSRVSGSNLRDFYIKEALAFIENHYMEEISVEDIAAGSGLNRSYFGRIFRESVGQSPQEFLISYRMTKATQMLMMTRLPIGEIGRGVGYPNQLHFSRAFKKIYGVSPKKWRDTNVL